MPSLRTPFALSSLLLVLTVAACGSGSALPKATSTPKVATTSTPAPLPTPIVSGSAGAIVNGHTISLKTFQLFLNVLVATSSDTAAMLRKPSTLATLRSRAMTEVIENQLIADYASAHHISVSPSAVNAQQQSDVATSGGLAAFKKRLAAIGLNLASYRALIGPNLLAQRVEQALFPVSKAKQPYAHVEHILITTKPKGKPARTDAQAKALAEQLLARIKGGASFAALAKKYSDDTGSAVSGGDLGKVTQGQTVPAFNKAAFSLRVGQPAVIHSRYGYHVIEVLSRGVGPAQPSQAVLQQQQTQFMAWLGTQQKRATIQRIATVRSG